MSNRLISSTIPFGRKIPSLCWSIYANEYRQRHQPNENNRNQSGHRSPISPFVTFPGDNLVYLLAGKIVERNNFHSGDPILDFPLKQVLKPLPISQTICT
jgi:hypothetical protein